MNGYLLELGNVIVSCISEKIHHSVILNSRKLLHQILPSVSFPPPIYTTRLCPKPGRAGGHIESMPIDQ